MIDSTKQPARRRLLPEDRREEILASATDLISAVGFNGTTIDDFARAAGISRPGLLHHFPSKERLLEGVLARRDFLDVQDASRDSTAATPLEARRVMTSVVERNAQLRELVQLYTILAAEALVPEHPAHDYFQSRQKLARERFARHLFSWHEDPSAGAVQLIAILDGLQLSWLRDPTVDLRKQWEIFADIFFVAP
jgi:AcrR family transcriptional regulator